MKEALKKLVRKAWRFQPAWLRRAELRLIMRLAAKTLDPNRPLLKGDVVVGGFLGTATGLGEGARQMLALFRAAGIDAKGANVSRFAVMEDFEAGSLWPEEAQEGGIAIFHVNPDLQNMVLGAVGAKRFRTRRLVGLWAWELELVPDQWKRALRCVDEVWAPSHFIADAIRKVADGKPVYVVPHSLDVEAWPTAPKNDPLPQFAGRPIVFFAFDVRSTIARKNPEAVIEAFRRATQGNPDPVLVLKVNSEKSWPEARAYIDRITAGMPDIYVMRDVLSSEGMKDLVARADVILSLHRSEGFGLLVAEGMAAAKPVIATGWSGNVDFMDKDCSVPVGYKLVPVKDPQNIYNHFGAVWAEPDIEEAAQALRRLLADPEARKRMGTAARAHVTKYFARDRWLKKLPQSFWDSLTPL
jgi:glycosyltransferase involved in cell wall biosynthesis